MTLKIGKSTPIPTIAAAFLAAGILVIAKLKAPFEMLIADRLLNGLGWIEIAALAVYAGILADMLITSKDTSKIRIRIWMAFSIVFFLQFILGVSGIDRLLMTGKLHIPVPAVVIAGPIFRGERFFMPILFLSTIALAGPGWCSYLCYIGAWDGVFSNARKRSKRIQPFWRWIRLGIFIMTPTVAILLRTFSVDPKIAGITAISFGVVSVGIMAFVSRRTGTMVHCTSICPLGFAGNLLGKLSPFRFRINSSCTSCGRCIPACRYGALTPERIEKRRPGITCTLCGDCLPSCPESSLGYRYFKMSPVAARKLFLVIVAALHAVFLGVARI